MYCQNLMTPWASQCIVFTQENTLRVAENLDQIKMMFFSSVPQDAKVMSWWDYGYQITAMANRTILVDNNTWNNTHISRVGQVSPYIRLYK